MIVGPPMYKVSTELWDWQVDFVDNMETGQTITGVFRALREVDNLDVTTELSAASSSVAGTVVSQPVHGGDSGTSYLLRLTGTRSDSRVFVAERRLFVRDAPKGVVGAAGSISGALEFTGAT